MKIAVVSDTHVPTKVKKLPQKLLEGLTGVDLIIHAGDIVNLQTLRELEQLAPVKAVQGNIDLPEIKTRIPERLTMKIESFKLGITHGHNLKGHIMDRLGHTFPEADIIIFGHTHRPFCRQLAGQLYFNPGSPTDRRLQPYYSFGIINIDKNGIDSRIIEFE